MQPGELRSAIDRILDADPPAASRLLDRFWRSDNSPAAAGFVVSRFEKLRGRVPLQPFRLAILRSFTVEPVVPLLRAHAFCAGIDLALHVGEFNAHAQEMLDPGGVLYAFRPDAAILAVQTRDAAPALWRDFAALEPAARASAANRATEMFRTQIDAFRAHSRASLIVHTLEQPAIEVKPQGLPPSGDSGRGLRY